MEMERQKAQAQAEAQRAVLDVQTEIERIRAEAKVMSEQIRALTADKDRQMKEEEQLQSEVVDAEKLRIEWADLRARETAGEDELVMKLTEAGIAAKEREMKRRGKEETGEDEENEI
jgi:hypothetical protein